MKRLSIALLGACFLLQIASLASAEIVFVSINGDTPDQSVLDAGLDEAPDEAYVNLLETYEMVTHYVTHDDPTPADLDILNAADLIIISRAVNSPAFQQANETEFWNTMVTSPVIMMSGYILRDSRLNFYSGGTIPDTTGAVKLEAIQPDHPVFAGVNLDGNNVMVDNYSDGLVEIPEANPTTQRGISVITDPIVGGDVIAQITADGTPAGGTIIAEWQTGATLNNGQNLSGDRMVFLSGSREAGGVAIPLGAGGYDLTEAGTQMFLNAVDYMHPDGILGNEPQVLRAQVDTETGQISIVNMLENAFTIDFIELTSANGNLDPTGSTLGSGTNDGTDWEIVGTASENDLSYFFLLGDETISANGGSVSLGTTFDTSTAEEDRDIAFRWHNAGGGTRRGIVEFVTTPDGNADIDGNGLVDGNDWKIMQRNWNMPGTLADGDANGDGTVDAADQDIWETAFLASAGGAAAASAAVPEPGAAVLLVLAVTGGLAVRRRSVA